jgi:hypothetical protein
MGEIRNAYEMLIVIPEEKKSLGRHRRGWEYNIKIDLRNIAWKGVDKIRVARDRSRWWCFVSTVTNLRVSQRAGNSEIAERTLLSTCQALCFM